MARATVDFPHPDSPTSPIASPAPRAKVSPGMTFTSPARVTYEMRASSSARIGASVTEADLAKADGEEIEADHERRDRRAREEGHVRPHRHHAVGVLDHAAPVGVGWGQADAEEAEGADDDHVVSGAQAHVHDQGSRALGWDLHQHNEIGRASC